MVAIAEQVCISKERERERYNRDWDQVQYLETKERKRYRRWGLRLDVISKVLHLM